MRADSRDCWVRQGISRRGWLLGAVAVLTASCSGPSADLKPLPDVAPTSYRLGPGDQVRIITFGEDQLTGEFRVDAAGDVSLPLLGNVVAAGLTPQGLAGRIRDALRKNNLFRDPSVSVEVVQYRPVFVLGEVNKPGQYPYQPGMTVVTAVAIAGGFTYRAVEDAFSIVRVGEGGSSEGRAGRETPVQPGDVITVYERHF